MPISVMAWLAIKARKGGVHACLTTLRRPLPCHSHRHKGNGLMQRQENPHSMCFTPAFLLRVWPTQ